MSEEGMTLLNVGLAIYLLCLAGLIYSLGWGGRDERYAALIIIVGAIGSEVAAHVSGVGFSAPEYGIMFVDAVAFIALMWLALISDRFWPLWAAAFQLVGTLCHVGFLLQQSIVATLYAAVQPFWAIPLIGSVIFGTIVQHRLRLTTKQ